ncbi:MAG: hypothetical protein M3P04_13865 [Actinomycetota bacterium]|nr:hypothetical protein [Actinomycetota bacterium]
MALTSANVRVAVTGEVLTGATSATAPTGTGGTTTGFTGLGYVGEDGVTEKRERSTDDIKAWQNAATVRTLITDSSLAYTFALLETTKATVELAYGTTVTQTGVEGNYVIAPSTTGGRKSFIIDIVDGANLKRIYIPQGEITEVGDVVCASGEAIGYEVTVQTYPDTVISGNAKVWETALHS